MKCASADLAVDGLVKDAAMGSPKLLKLEYQCLQMHDGSMAESGPERRNLAGALTGVKAP